MNHMAMSDNDKKPATPPSSTSGDKSAEEPKWAKGLKNLYSSVVDEPLPDTFKDLLAKLDENGGK